VPAVGEIGRACLLEVAGGLLGEHGLREGLGVRRSHRLIPVETSQFSANSDYRRRAHLEVDVGRTVLNRPFQEGVDVLLLHEGDDLA
jgi:hypothetical protein